MSAPRATAAPPPAAAPPTAEASLDELWRLLAAGARGAEGMKVGDAFHLTVIRESSATWNLRACITDVGSAPLPLGAAFVDVTNRQQPAAGDVVRLLVDHARAAAVRNLEALRAALGGTP